MNNLEKSLLKNCKNGDFYKLEKLLKKNINPNIQNKKGNTPLHLIYKWNINFLKLLLDSGADPNIKNYKNDTILSLTIKNNMINKTELLL